MKFILYCGFHAGLRKGEIVQARPECLVDLKLNIQPARQSATHRRTWIARRGNAQGVGCVDRFWIRAMLPRIVRLSAQGLQSCVRVRAPITGTIIWPLASTQAMLPSAHREDSLLRSQSSQRVDNCLVAFPVGLGETREACSQVTPRRAGQGQCVRSQQLGRRSSAPSPTRPGPMNLEAYFRSHFPRDAMAKARESAENIRFKAALKQRVLLEIDAWIARHGFPERN